ncbi:mitotic spindle assembly checkpoint protein MAD1-like [Mercenaria mercenaria]|uniref:mitotic spindle assembly checkpoint protein MAD1-like n=1 Tax=Mercenaria mercenaria TaxID=6596 RepID=UPI00234F04E1|nr:mitotic spindle assembly checkpoint protein MAD1-like [Mercenaria mercenaria]
MGNCLGYPPYIESQRREKVLARQTRSANNLQGSRTVVLPYNSFSMNTRTPSEETEVKRFPDTSFSQNTSQVEIETIKLSSNNTSRASSFKSANRYIKRYRNEEEKLIDMLQERERLVRAAITQGQELRAKCNRYKEELDNLKALSDVDMTDVEWKKMYNELDKRNRDLKEELDILTARNKNGRDHLNHQNEVIQQLNAELQKERIEKQRLLSSSLTSLKSIGVKDKKGKLMITQLEVDNKLLQERLNDVTVRNQRGREYLSKLEAEKRDQDAMLAKLKSQLLMEKAEKDQLKTRVEIMSSTQNLSAVETEPSGVYAQVQKKKITAEEQNDKRTHDGTHSDNYETVVHHHENIETKSTGFDIDQQDPRNDSPSEHVQSQVYEEVGFGENNGDKEPRITTYVMNSSQSTNTESMTSTPRIVEDIITHDPEPIWDYVPASAEVDAENVTTRF